MPLVIVPAREHSVLEAYPPLSGKIVFPYEREYLIQIVCLLDRHHLRPLVRERVVETDGKMAPGLIQVAAELRYYPDR